MVHALGQALQLPSMLVVIMATGRIAEATKSCMDMVLAKAAQANAAARENVVAFLNFMTLDPLPFSPNSFNSNVVNVTSSLPDEATTDVS